MENVNDFLAPALMLFATGLLGTIVKKNLIMIFMCIELMLCGAMLAMLAFASAYNDINGGVFVFFVLTIAAAEVAVGLAIVSQLFRLSASVSVSDMNALGD